MDYYKIGQKIRKYRKANGLSQEQLAEKVSISVTHMSHIETGNTKLSLPVIADIAESLGIQVDDLLREDYFKRQSIEEDILEILDSCDEQQLKILKDILKSTKTALDKYK